MSIVFEMSKYGDLVAKMLATESSQFFSSANDYRNFSHDEMVESDNLNYGNSALH